MVINMYRVEDEHNILECFNKLRDKGYNLIDKDYKYKTQFILFLKNKSHEPSNWKELLNNNFDVSQYKIIEKKELLDESNETRAILLVKKFGTFFLFPFGLAFHDIDEIVDYDFGLKFAERALRETDIKTKSVDFFQNNKLKEIVNYNNKASTTIGATESFSLISGEPTDTKRYGKMINCGVGVKFSKVVDNSNFFEVLSSLCQDTVELMRIKNKITLPRITKYSKKSNISKCLNEELRKQILDGTNTKMEVRELLDIGDKTYSLRDLNIQIRVKNSGTPPKKIGFFSISSIQEYFEELKNDGLIFSLEDVFLTCKNDFETFTKELNHFIFCDLIYKDKTYVLQSGFWGEYNQKYLSVLNSTLDKIPVKIESSRTVMKYSKSEDKYIREKAKEKNYKMIHKKNMKPKRYKYIKRYGVELGDLYIKNDNKGTLIAVKKGGNVKDTIYSLEQSILSLKVLNNLNDFEITPELKAVINDENEIRKIDSTKISWIFLSDYNDKEVYKNEQTKINNILNKSISLKKDFNSLFLKNKLVEWYLLCQESSMFPEIIFEVPIFVAISLQKKYKKNLKSYLKF